MPSTRAPTLLLVQSLVLAGFGCSAEGTGTGQGAGGTSGSMGGRTGGTGGASGGEVSGAGSSGIVGATGGGTAPGGSTAAGGAPIRGGTSAGGIHAAGGGSSPGGGASGGTSATGGTVGLGGTAPTGGFRGRGGARGTGGSSATGGSSPTGGTTSAAGGGSAMGGSAAGGSTGQGSCSFTVTTHSTSSKMATVGIVEWSASPSSLSSAQVVYTLDNAAPDILNKGGTAPVDLTQTNHRTLLLGLKPSSNYTFHIEAKSSDGTACTSPDYTMKTGSLSGAPSVTRTATQASAQAAGFIVTSSALGTGAGMGGGPSSVYIIDADGAVVWYVAGPAQCSRARMDYEAANMWMLALNVGNTGGEMRYVSMDGQTGENDVNGLSSAHHDFTVLPGGVVAAMVWASSGSDPESNLIEREPDGTLTTKFRIGSNLYAGGQSFMGGSGDSYHCNYVVYHEADDSYTISDRNPNLVVKVTRAGNPVWQIGGDCSAAPAPKCAPGTWKVNHGHDFDPNGNMLLFNNGQSGASHVFEFQITDSGSFGITTVKDFTSGNYSSNSMGDVQRLPNGNTLITYSRAGVILEVDPSWATVQTISGEFGYANWRETLYGPPPRL